MMKKKSILPVIMIAVITGFSIVRSIIPSYSSVLESNWGFELPVKALWKEIYETNTGASFHGDGIRYHVFSYGKESVVENMLPWSYTEGTTLSWTQIEGEEKCYNSYSEDGNTWLADLNVPQKFLPVYDGVAYWYGSQEDNSQIIVIWNPAAERVHIIENFI